MTGPADRKALIEVIDKVVAGTEGLDFGENILAAMEAVGVVSMPVEATEEMEKRVTQWGRNSYRVMLKYSPYRPGDGG